MNKLLLIAFVSGSFVLAGCGQSESVSDESGATSCSINLTGASTCADDSAEVHQKIKESDPKVLESQDETAQTVKSPSDEIVEQPRD